MCGGDLGKVFSNPIVDTILSVAAPYAGAEFLGPLLGGGALGGALGGAIGGGGTSALEGGNITSDLVNAGVGGIGGGIVGAGGVGNALTSAGNGLGGLFGDSTLGTDIGTSLSNFSPTSGLSSFLGGTAAPTSDLSTQGTAALDNSPAGVGTALNAATPSAAINSGTLPSGVSAAGAGSGGTVGGGLSDTGGTFGESISAPSASGIGASDPSVSIGSIGQFGGSTPSGFTPGVNAVNINNGGLVDNITGGTTYSPAGGNNVGILSSLFGGGNNAAQGLNNSGQSAGANITNSLLRGGLGYLLNSPNTAGANAINSATQQAQAGFAPYTAAGKNAENTLAALYGNNGTAAQTAAEQGFQNTPGYQFAQNQGINAVDANAAALGQTLSGNNQQAVNNYAQNTANQTYNNYVNQLQNLASGGLSAAGGSGTAGLTGASAISQLDQNKANNLNTAVGTGLQGLFPSGGINLASLLSGNGGGGNGLLSLFGIS